MLIFTSKTLINRKAKVERKFSKTPTFTKRFYVVCNLMRKLLRILSVTFSLSSCGQDYKEYNFQDIGLNITGWTYFEMDIVLF